MEENKYKNLDDELLVVEMQNTISEIKAFLQQSVISYRKYTQLETKVNEISREIESRMKSFADSEESLAVKTLVSNKIAELKTLLSRLSEKVQTPPQPQ